MDNLATLPTAVPAPQHAAFPGALLLVSGLFLIVWALRDWGVISTPSATAKAATA